MSEVVVRWIGQVWVWLISVSVFYIIIVFLRQLKIYDLGTYNVKHSILYSAPVLSLALSVSFNDNT